MASLAMGRMSIEACRRGSCGSGCGTTVGGRALCRSEAAPTPATSCKRHKLRISRHFLSLHVEIGLGAAWVEGHDARRGAGRRCLPLPEVSHGRPRAGRDARRTRSASLRPGGAALRTKRASLGSGRDALGAGRASRGMGRASRGTGRASLGMGRAPLRMGRAPLRMGRDALPLGRDARRACTAALPLRRAPIAGSDGLPTIGSGIPTNSTGCPTSDDGCPRSSSGSPTRG
jgi:hypothetical protein